MGDALGLPFQDGIFDQVFCVATLHHLPEPPLGVRELIRVLRLGERLCFLDPRRFRPTQLLGCLRNSNVEVGTFKTSGKGIRRLLRSLGVSEVQMKRRVLTPKTPESLRPLYDVIDRTCDRVGALGGLSVMFCAYGSK